MSLKSIESYNFYTFDSPESAAISLAEKIIARTRSAIQKKGKCVWAVSGGSSILNIYDALSKHHEELRAWPGFLTVTWVDERGVPHSSADSNFGNAYNYFWKNYEGVRLIPVPYHQSMDESAGEYESILSQHGVESIDITLLGMGTDGHTASLFPHNKALKEMAKNIVSVEDPSVELPRISMSYPFINASESIYLYFYGREKVETFKKAVLSGSINRYPILGIDKNKLEIYSDRELEK